jgi:hypothetical protein
MNDNPHLIRLDGTCYSFYIQSHLKFPSTLILQHKTIVRHMQNKRKEHELLTLTRSISILDFSSCFITTSPSLIRVLLTSFRAFFKVPCNSVRGSGRGGVGKYTHRSCIAGFNFEKKRVSLEPSTHAPNALSLNTLCRGYCGQRPRAEPTKGRHKNSGPLIVFTNPLNLALTGSHFCQQHQVPSPRLHQQGH